MRKINTDERSREPEVMDNFEIQGETLEKTLADIDKVNQFLGGTQISIRGIKNILEVSDKRETTTIADVGCGNGTVLRAVADYGRKKNINFKLIGIDGNPHTIAIAENLSQEYPEISYKTINIFSEEFKKMYFDILLCTLTLHHFKDKEIISVLNQFVAMSSLGIVINDLHRSKLAYYLFKLFCAVFIHNKIAREDGLVSILRGFKRKDLLKYGKTVKVTAQKIKWKWAFRYQWILIK